MNKPLRIGIIALSAERGWATAAHIPALRALSDDFELAGVANTSLASARAAAAAFGLPRAFESTAQLVASPDIDVVVVSVKVPHHRELVSEALNAGKSRRFWLSAGTSRRKRSMTMSRNINPWVMQKAQSNWGFSKPLE